MAISTSIVLDVLSLKKIYLFYKSKTENKSFVDVILKYENENDKFLFKIGQHTNNELKLSIILLNQETGIEEIIKTKVLQKYYDLFTLYNFSSIKNSYNVYLKPEPIKNNYQYKLDVFKDYQHGLCFTIKMYPKKYLKWIRLSANNYENAENLWNLSYALLKNICISISEKDMFIFDEDYLNDVKRKLNYYGFTETISPDDFLRKHYTKVFKSINLFNTVISGLLIYSINKLLLSNFTIKDELTIKNTLDKLSMGYYMDIYSV